MRQWFFGIEIRMVLRFISRMARPAGSDDVFLYGTTGTWTIPERFLGCNFSGSGGGGVLLVRLMIYQ